ncbi:branched-chain amino acid ABC transporter permease [Paralcaligenes sp. KSB-10]|jgi:branched-chain amino acid transport system permease protein|uniref:branched-chain amino acid ABC transporter permease n=1 Tax=Paralcaligenes sp. KSB-10 TaxID=2901142 RepID=UPI001E58E0DE|nr:branched-chain amino acid ABC transporter permease [Paralcaligenes sp. KSB-10]UHL63129.1 branched-chain amino acid ABC transporter permease [Paralcaligenes sp. KSB-10]
MDYFLVSLLNGLIYGLLLFMVSAGLTLIFGMMGVLNFAHASFYMLGAYFAYLLGPYIGFWPAIACATVLVGLVGVVVERYFLRRVHKYGHAHELLLTFGLSFIIAELVKLFFGNYPVNYHVPAMLSFSAFHIGPLAYPVYRLLMGGVALLMFGVIYLLLTRTRVGIIVRSAIYKPAMAEALGHNVPRVFMAVFGVGAALAGLAGAVAGAFYTTNPNMAIELGVLVFVVVVVGGLGSLEGAMLASLLIGLLTAFSVGVDYSLADLFTWFGAGDWAQRMGGLFTLKLSGLSATIPYALMLLILLVRPSGLMGEKE